MLSCHQSLVWLLTRNPTRFTASHIVDIFDKVLVDIRMCIRDGKEAHLAAVSVNEKTPYVERHLMNDQYRYSETGEVTPPLGGDGEPLRRWRGGGRKRRRGGWGSSRWQQARHARPLKRRTTDKSTSEQGCFYSLGSTGPAQGPEPLRQLGFEQVGPVREGGFPQLQAGASVPCIRLGYRTTGICCLVFS